MDRVPETFVNKGIRKFTTEPFVPMGAVLSAGFLVVGVFGKVKQSQKMMRFRVAAQGFCFLAMCTGAYRGVEAASRDKILKY